MWFLSEIIFPFSLLAFTYDEHFCYLIDAKYRENGTKRRQRDKGKKYWKFKQKQEGEW